MKEIIFLLLFTYPGAFVQLLRNEFWPQLVRHKEESATIAAARYFLYSAIVAVISISICTWLMPNAQGLAHFAGLLLVGWNAAIYLAVSAVACVFVAWLLPLCSKGFRRLFQIKHETGSASVWSDFYLKLFDESVCPYGKYAVMCVRKDGKIIAAGVPDSFSSLPDPPTEILLSHKDHVIELLENDDLYEEYIVGSLGCYYNIKEGYEIEFFSAPKFMEEQGLVDPKSISVDEL